MQTVHSGTTTERIMRAGLAMILINVFAAWFLRDGHEGYARQNAADLVKSLGLDPEPLPVINAELTANEGRRIEELRPGAPLETTVAGLGEPSLTHEDSVYFLARGGHLRARIENGQVVEARWAAGTHTETDILWQTWIGYTLGAFGLALLAQFIRVITTRVSVADAGLKVRGRAVVPFSAMTGLQAGQYEKTGRIGVEYTVEERKSVVHLDNYVVRRFPEVMAVICEGAGFANPLASEQRSGSDGGGSGTSDKPIP